ncbi:DUF429 domain-containing protein [Aldersonia sp. NBC_00410]|uniref:DUF429 domain-containing protein n=1 Tax=Aldersonia sp. NBC_00410 TaxID=2975954 RepID=UPI002258A977|nr:DUF429 domain-containing protein [Aldersonia sp. NBC_00410]MCX5045244.1 DUF429 domain-containing protein [Aldersonia sp. NBC_00410]
MSSLTIGVDLAAEPARTALAVLEWRPNGALVTNVRLGVSDAAITDAAKGAGRIGIDSPFGWPDAFVEFVAAHHEGHPPTVELQTREQRRPLTKRRTDLVVAQRTGIMPLSVSADLIAHVALRCAGLLARLDVVDRVDGRAVEVYPAAALKVWRLPFRGKSTTTGLTAMIDGLRAAAPWLDLGAFREQVSTQHDAFDAVVAALLARAVAIGATYLPDEAERAVAVREGWVHVPRNPLSALISQAGSTDEIT